MVMRMAMQEMNDRKNTVYPEKNAYFLLTSMCFTLNLDQTPGSPTRSQLLTLIFIFFILYKLAKLI